MTMVEAINLCFETIPDCTSHDVLASLVQHTGRAEAKAFWKAVGEARRGQEAKEGMARMRTKRLLDKSLQPCA